MDRRPRKDYLCYSCAMWQLTWYLPRRVCALGECAGVRRWSTQTPAASPIRFNTAEGKYCVPPPHRNSPQLYLATSDCDFGWSQIILSPGPYEQKRTEGLAVSLHWKLPGHKETQASLLTGMAAAGWE